MMKPKEYYTEILCKILKTGGDDEILSHNHGDVFEKNANRDEG